MPEGAEFERIGRLYPLPPRRYREGVTLSFPYPTTLNRSLRATGRVRLGTVS
jgi:hypothetical protein